MALLADYYVNTDTGDDGNPGTSGSPKASLDGALDQIVVDSGGTLDKNVTVHLTGATDDTLSCTTSGIAHGGYILTIEADAVGPIWAAGSYILKETSTFARALEVVSATGAVVVRHLQIDLNSQGNSTGIYTLAGIFTDGCFIKTGGTSAIGIYSASSSAPTFTNTIVTGVPDGITVADWGNTYVYNCDIANASSTGIKRVGTNGTKPTVKNCAVFNTGDDFSGSFATIDYCASDDGDGTNPVTPSGGGAWWPDDFADAANNDFTLLSSSNLVGSGVDLSGIFTNDINDDTRTVPWDLGADAYIPAAGFEPAWARNANQIIGGAM